MKIGFIGTGNMGAPMAANLAAAGHTVTAFDVAVSSQPDGLKAASSAAQAASDQDVVFTMLPNGEIVRAVAAEIVPAMASASPGAVFVDCSTIDVQSARAVAALAVENGLQALDAPVSGGVLGSTAGTLTFMVGGENEAFEKVKPLFDIMGQKAVLCGPTGNGQAAKICNNMISGASIAVLSEAFVLADKLGLDRSAMFNVVSTSSGSSWPLLNMCPAPGVGAPSPGDNNYKPGFSADLMLKDLRLSQQAAQDVDADTPMGKRACELYEEFVERGDGSGMDVTAIILAHEKRGRRADS